MSFLPEYLILQILLKTRWTKRMPIPQHVLDLVKKFEEHKESYSSTSYNETQLRREFLDPFFEALGWDVSNKQGYAEAYKEVIHEDAVKIGTATKAPDYSFRVGGTRKFFVEAKKPFINIKDDIDPAFQLRRYAWSAKLPLSILTDFQEFAVYDCRLKPVKTDKASIGRILYIKYDEYEKRWDEIASIFSKEAVLKGSFDKYAETNRAKKGTTEVDDAFLAEIENWRDILARNIAIRNDKLSPRELNFSVQRTIDRLIFLRICEDRGIEDYGQLLSHINGENIYRRLRAVFQKADERYNSGLFHFNEEKGRRETPDNITLKLDIDDKVLKQIIENLYYPDSAYEFSVLPADILGQVYEQFLGKVIRLTVGHQAKVEDKPEVKKAGGVFYTPTYIVDYIVKNTVGKLLEDKTPKQVAGLRILDPACGSGSFLIGAYQYLLDWHQDWYTKNNPNKWLSGKSPTIYKARAGEYRLTTPERKKILLNNIYGVDIDTQAVEVTKLSLLLKVLEGENEQTIAQQLRLFHERALPDLGNNIKCGNSLIGTDYFVGVQESMGLYADEDDEQIKINAFDWEGKDGFQEIMANGGFDAVIGNPPYVRSQTLGAPQRDYYSRRYKTATATYDIYVLFVEKAMSLIDKNGRCAFIMPNKFFTTDYGQGLRLILSQRKNLEYLVDFEDSQVFVGAGTYTTLIFLYGTSIQEPKYTKLGHIYKSSGILGLQKTLYAGNLPFSSINLSNDGSRWTIATGQNSILLERLQKTFPTFLSLEPHIYQGLKTSADKVYMITLKKEKAKLAYGQNCLGEDCIVERRVLQQVVKGECVQRYNTDLSKNLFILYPYEPQNDGSAHLFSPDKLSKEYPKTWEYLKKYKEILGDRDGGIWLKKPDWYAYARGQNIATFLYPKFLIPYMTTQLRANLDVGSKLFFVNITTGGYGVWCNMGLHKPEYFLGLFNSRLLDSCIKQMTNMFRGGYFAINKQALERLPIRTIDFSLQADKALHSKMVNLVSSILDLNKKLPLAKTEQEKTIIQRQIDSTDRRIDELVYELYGLTEEEIKIVESSSEGK
jgi:type I restriction-modification system DNA methylase subunit/predicted type IV restriction endonuclease